MKPSTIVSALLLVLGLTPLAAQAQSAPLAIAVAEEPVRR
jgi:hypothetical protein